MAFGGRQGLGLVQGHGGYYYPRPPTLVVSFTVQQPVDLLDNFGTSRLVLLMCVCWPACCISACPPLVVPGIALPAPLPHSCAGSFGEKKALLLVVLAAFRVGSGNRLLVDLAAYCEMVLNQSTGYFKFYITQKKVRSVACTP